MSKYTVTSARIVGCDEGDTVTADDLPAGTNVEALIAAGHLTAHKTPKAATAKKEGK